MCGIVGIYDPELSVDIDRALLSRIKTEWAARRGRYADPSSSA